jgi:hypothetical protein
MHGDDKESTVNRFGRIGWIGLAVALAVAVSAAATRTPSARSATTSQLAAVKGIEIVARHTQGTFTGYSTGPLAGDWVAVVEHTPLSPNATITGGTLTLVTDRNHAARTITARFTGGTVTNTNPGGGCTDQTYRVIGNLSHFDGHPSGRFSVKLTHYRHRLLGACIAYFATATGTLSGF